MELSCLKKQHSTATGDFFSFGILMHCTLAILRSARHGCVHMSHLDAQFSSSRYWSSLDTLPYLMAAYRWLSLLAPDFPFSGLLL